MPWAKQVNLKNAVGNAVDRAGNALGNALGKYTDMIPNLESIPGLNNFLPASMQDLMSLQNMDGMLAAFRNSHSCI